MADKYSKIPIDLSSPAIDAFPIVPSDVTVFTQPTRAIYVGTGGDISVTMCNKDQTDTTITFKNISDGFFVPIRIKKVLATGTTANNIIGLY